MFKDSELNNSKRCTTCTRWIQSKGYYDVKLGDFSIKTLETECACGKIKLNSLSLKEKIKLVIWFPFVYLVRVFQSYI